MHVPVGERFIRSGGNGTCSTPHAPSGCVPPARARSAPSTLPAPGPDDVVVRTRFSAVSRGTETLVFRGGVPASQHARMRAPFQVGRVPGARRVRLPQRRARWRTGPRRWSGGPCSVSPRTDPVRRAGRRGDRGPGRRARGPRRARRHRRDRGQRPVGRRSRWSATGSRWSAAGWSAAASPRCWPASPACGSSWSTSTRRARGVAAALGVGFAAPADAAGDCDLVVHASATDAGLARALELLADEGEVVELSWYGDRRVTLPLGEAFHSRRLTIRASQVGTVAPARRGRRSYADRMALALRPARRPGVRHADHPGDPVRGPAAGDAAARR